MESELRLDERNDDTGVRNGVRGYSSSLTSEGRTISAPQLVIIESASVMAFLVCGVCHARRWFAWRWLCVAFAMRGVGYVWRCWKRIFVFV